MRSKLWRSAIFYLVLTTVASLFAACAPPAKEMARFPIEVTDQTAKVVKLERKPERIISLAPSNTEILFALGLGDKVVGVTKFCNFPPEATKKPIIGGWSTPDIEKVISLSPDLILASDIHRTRVTPLLENKGMTVLTLEPKTLDGVLEAINLVGEVTGAQEEASRLVEKMGNRIRAVTDQTRALPQEKMPRVLYLAWHNPLKVGGRKLNTELIEKAGGIDIFSGLTGPGISKLVSLEEIISRNPQVMLGLVGHGEGKDLSYRYLMTEPRLANTEARRNNRVYPVDNDLIGRPGPRIVEGLELVARCIHPEIFQ